MVGIDDGVGFFQEPIYSTNLVEVIFPFGWMLDNNPKINIFVFGFDSPGKLLAVSCI
jgi:hypothetical protein